MGILYLIDFSNWACKYKAILTNCSTNVNGVSINTSVLKGICNSIKNIPYQDIAIVLDGTPAKSLSINSSYKGTRYHESDGIVYVNKVEVLDVMTQLGKVYDKNVSVICAPNHETDQVIASIALSIAGELPKNSGFISKLNEHNLYDDPRLKYINGTLESFDISDFDSVVIGSSDADFIQLLRFKNVYIDSSISGKAIYHEATSKSTSETTPTASILYKALLGDSSDNIPKLDFKNIITGTALVRLLNESVKSYDIVSKFYQRVINNQSSTGNDQLDKVATFINATNQVKKFTDNFYITNLTFSTFPRKIVLNKSTDVFELLSTYKINY